MTETATTELRRLLDEFEHECFMLRVEASETRARADVVRDSYERIRDEFAGRISATIGSGECEHHMYDARCPECGYGPIYCPSCRALVRKAVKR